MKAIIIPIKTNNLRLPGKNTMMLSGKPLYQYLFETVSRARDFTVFIDSSDSNILKIAEQYGFKTIKRKATLNGPDTSGNDLIENALREVSCDIIGQFFVTTPFLKLETIKTAFKKIEEENVDACFGLYPVYDRFWQDNKPVNHNFKSLVGTQFMKPLMREAGFYVFRRSSFMKEKSRICEKYTTFEVDSTECVDIDTLEDFALAEALVEKGLV